MNDSEYPNTTYYNIEGQRSYCVEHTYDDLEELVASGKTYQEAFKAIRAAHPECGSFDYTEDEAYSKIVMVGPGNFQHYLKKPIIPLWLKSLLVKAGLASESASGRYRWVFHHRSNTAGCWMWPDGMALRGDGISNKQAAIDHADKLDSDWFSGDRNLE